MYQQRTRNKTLTGVVTALLVYFGVKTAYLVADHVAVAEAPMACATDGAVVKLTAEKPWHGRNPGVNAGDELLPRRVGGAGCEEG